MANDRKSSHEHDEAQRLLERKLGLMRDMLETTRQELLLVDLEGLAPLLERKDHLIGDLTAVDQALERLGAIGLQRQQDAAIRTDLTRLVEAILENERTLEDRMGSERLRLRQELRDLEHESQVRGYLERQRPRNAKVDLTR